MRLSFLWINIREVEDFHTSSIANFPVSEVGLPCFKFCQIRDLFFILVQV
jgi:hypothetical protein